MEPKAFTLASNGGRLRVLVTELKICEPGAIQPGEDANSLTLYKGIWDTGATNSVITQKIVDDLKLKPTGVTKINSVEGEGTSPVYLVDFLLPMGVIIPGLRVTLGKLAEGNDALIGMDVITLGDFSITNKNNNTKMSFRIPSMHEVDYVQDFNQGLHLPRKERRERERQRRKAQKRTNK